MGEKGRILTGARARLSIGSRKVGYARNVAVGENIEYEEVRVLDNIQVEEYVPVAYGVTFTASQFRIVGETVKQLGWFPNLGKTTSEHLQNILLTGDLSASIEDTKTNNVVATVEQVKLSSHNYSIDTRGIVGEDVTFVAIRLRDESGE